MSEDDSSRGKRYAVACRTSWFWDVWDEGSVPGEWLRVREPDELARVEEFGPRYVFFPHWSEIVPASFVTQYECIGFHSAPLPYGRGGSPVQNMIVRGHEETELVAFRMTDELDTGEVYLRREMSLLGGGDEIYLRIGRLAAAMIEEIIREEPDPTPQEGDAVEFERRQPEQSRLPEDLTIREVFDRIRMLDAEGYPSAFIDHGDFRLRFSRPALRRGAVEADVRIERRD